MYEVISPIFIFIGLIFLIGSVGAVRMIVVQASKHAVGWYVVLYLIVFFIAGYFLTLLFVLVDHDTRVTFLTSMIFLGGGVFVFLIVKLSKRTLDSFHRLNVLENENIHAKIVQKRLHSILDNAAEGIITFSKNGIIDSCNKAACELFDYSEEEFVGEKVWSIIVGYNEDLLPVLLRTRGKRLELKGVDKKGNAFPISFKTNEMVLNGQYFYTSIVMDISERQKLLARMQQLVDHDDLTNLYNKRYFLRRVRETLEALERGGGSGCLLYMDLDNFKKVNDFFGHDTGDRLLKKIAVVLRRGRRKSDCAARLAGDEFALLLYNTNATNGVNVAEKIRSTLASEVFNYEGDSFSVTCSIGVFLLEDSSLSVDEALSRADTACYSAKGKGKNRVELYDNEREEVKK